jgi:ATP-binding cassette, subfamily C, bacterial
MTRRKEGTLLLFKELLLAYPGRSAVVLVCLIIGGLAEGVGIATILPLLELAVGQSGEKANAITRAVQDLLSRFGLQPSIEVLLTIMVVAMILKAALVLLAAKQVGYTSAYVATDLRLSLIRNLMKAKWEYFVKQPMGRFSNAMATEAERASVGYVTVCRILADGIQISVYSVLALYISWQVTIGGLGVGLFIMIALKRLIVVARQAGASQTDLLKSLSIRLTDGLQGIKTLKAMSCEDRLAPLLERESVSLNRAKQRQVMSKEGLSALQEPIVIVAVALTIYFAVTWWSGNLDAVMVLIILFWRTVGRIGNLQKEYQRAVNLESAYWSIRDSIEKAGMSEEKIGGTIEPSLKEGISFERVAFAYDGKQVLSGATFFIPSGRFTSILGPSGTGKTTIADLIAGLLKPQSGEIRVDGTSLAKVDMRKWRSMIGYVPQEIFLFHDTIESNVTLGDRSIGRMELVEALKSAGAWEFVSSLPGGIKTILGERGARISGGQRQRIAIARALIRKPSLLILDEVTTALDPKTEAEICMELKGLSGKMTIVAISHQKAMMEVADFIYRVHQGVVESVGDTLSLKGTARQAR